MLTRDDAQRLTFSDQWFRYWFPYQFVKLEVPKPKHVYLPLNRDYKPLGVTTGDWVEYEDYLHQAVIFARDPHKFENVWHYTEGLYLYEDAQSSRLDYFQRLERLLRHSPKLFGISN